MPHAWAATLSPSQNFTVVIDPGHGGHDNGTTIQEAGATITEKDLTLRLALQTAKALQEKGIKTLLTRNEDREVPLADRTALANRVRADLFISIHVNSGGEKLGPAAQGIETYILNHSSDASSKRLADLENAVLKGSIAGPGTHHQAPSNPIGFPGVAPGGSQDVALILKDLLLDGNVSESKRAACVIQDSLVRNVPGANPGRNNRGVKQALFYVLLGADMPSVLVEAGFLSNPVDRKRLTQWEGRRRIGIAIADAVSFYQNQKRGYETASTLSKCKVH